jgi:hypothetical protein
MMGSMGMGMMGTSSKLGSNCSIARLGNQMNQYYQIRSNNISTIENMNDPNMGGTMMMGGSKMSNSLEYYIYYGAIYKFSP